MSQSPEDKAAVERALAEVEQPCQVLKLGHHGSATSSDPRFLDAFAPEIAIASAVAVMVRLMSAGVAANSCASNGSSDCGP